MAATPAVSVRSRSGLHPRFGSAEILRRSTRKTTEIRGGWTRTSDLMLPTHPRYQAALRPDIPFI